MHGSSTPWRSAFDTMEGDSASLASWKATRGWETESLTYSDSDTDSIYDAEPLVYPESEIESIVDPHEAVASVDAFAFFECKIELTSHHTEEIASVLIDTEIAPALEASCRDVPAGRKAPPCKRKIANTSIAMRTRAGSIRATRSNVHAETSDQWEQEDPRFTAI